jgi:hypothetical protein
MTIHPSSWPPLLPLAGLHDLRVSVARVSHATAPGTLGCGETHIHQGDSALIAVRFQAPPQGHAP